MILIFYLPKFLFFSNINVIPFKVIPMETLFPLLKSLTGMVFSMSVTLFWMFSKVLK